MRDTDLRLAVPAGAAWLAAAAAVGLPWRTAALAAVVAGGVSLPAAALRRRVVLAVVVGAALGAASAALHVYGIRTNVVAQAAARHQRGELTLTLVRDPVRRSSHGRGFVLADATVTAVGGTRTRAPVLVIAHGNAWSAFLPGQRLRVPARLAPARRGDSVSAVALAAGPATPLGHPPWWQQAAGVVRARLRSACRGLPADERGLVPGLVVGDVSQMPASLTTAFQVSGLTHLNAVSGENCAIVLGAVLAVSARTRLGRRGRVVVAALALLGFVVLARPSPSVLRAAVMGGIALVSLAAGRRTQPVPLLGGAVLVLLLVNPFLARAPGFALSVLATSAIVVLAPRWTDRLAKHVPRPVAAAIAVPAAAQLACTPVLVALFGQLTPWAVPANLLAAPAVAPATLAGIAAALTAVVAMPVAAALAALAAIPAAWLVLVARALSALPGAGARWPAGVSGLVLLAAAAAVLTTVLVAGRRLRSRAMLAAWPP